ncbi:hypothetical protein C8J56DRAFT_890837 [Mycena floridula]|nr:hypothetical protein C8J56DRAFT_890837 [Mycena floridula]
MNCIWTRELVAGQTNEEQVHEGLVYKRNNRRLRFIEELKKPYLQWAIQWQLAVAVECNNSEMNLAQYSRNPFNFASKTPSDTAELLQRITAIFILGGLASQLLMLWRGDGVGVNAGSGEGAQHVLGAHTYWLGYTLTELIYYLAGKISYPPLISVPLNSPDTHVQIKLTL